MMKQITTTALTAAALAAFAGCSVESGDVRTTEAYSSSLNCNENSGINPLKAALAVAMSREMGQLDPLTFLEKPSGVVQVSAAGLEACEQNGASGCPNVKAILELQDKAVSDYIPRAALDPTTFREDLKASFDRQRNHEKNLKLNYKDKVPKAHKLSHTGLSDRGACGIHYDFAAEGEDVENLEHRMPFFGGDQNPFIAFHSEEGLISIDPTGTMNGDTTTEDGMCTEGCYVYGWDLYGDCCTCNGNQGTYRLAPWNYSMMYCSY